MAEPASGNSLSTLPTPVRRVLERRPAHSIDGSWVETEKSIPVIDPSSGKQISAIAAGTAADIDAAVSAANRALKSPQWTGRGPAGRERLLSRLADLIESRADLIAQIETLDNGMPLW